jgi:hypothetical protein
MADTEMSIDQFFIFLFSGGSIFFLSGKRPIIGFAMGLCGQPFWFYTAWQKGQAAILVLAFWYTFCHARGLIREWRKK